LAELIQAGVLLPFCNLLETKDWNIIIVVLDGLTNILHTAQKMGEIDRLAIMIEEVGGLDKIEALQHHQNEQVYQKSMAIIDTFFSEKVCPYMHMHIHVCIYIFFLFFFKYTFYLKTKNNIIYKKQPMTTCSIFLV